MAWWAWVGVAILCICGIGGTIFIAGLLWAMGAVEKVERGFYD